MNTGDDLSLTAAGAGFSSWKWQKDGADIPGATGTGTTISYTKSSVTSADAGVYKVILTNSTGQTTSSSPATVTVS